jgi:diguanylate cyclase (GGDEF)-like protein
MTDAEPTAGSSAPLSRRVRAVRRSNAYSAVGPVLAISYVVGTWGAPHRPLMLGVIGAMLAVAVFGSWWAASIARSRARVVLQFSGVVASLTGSAVLGLLDGGVASPLGALIPFSLIFLAILVPPRAFVGVAALGLAAYWSVALLGDPPPPGYPFAHTLGFGGTAYLCVRHARVLASLRRRLADISRIDPLTGCLNRRGFDERLEEELAEGTRTGDPVTLVLVDLDRFKEINDTHGHQAGDELLAWIGRSLTGELRAHDAVGRLGGDEFAVILGDTDPDGAAILVERLRAATHGTAPASFGYASYPADASTATELKHIADERLYADKAARDRPVPSADAVAAARGQVERQTPAVVSRRERRRHSIANSGWLSVSMGVTGLLYVGLFAAGHPNRLGMAALSALGGGLGLAVLAAADWLSRSAAARTIMGAIAALLFVISAGVAFLDGGVSAPTGVGLSMAMPLVALSTRARAVLPALGAAALLYLGVAVFAGASSGWYVVAHLLGAIAASLVCALQGSAAARQRALLNRLSRADVLTGCLNRRGFEERFTAEISHAHRTGRPVTMLILDLDGFKQLNDSRGHAAGDELLAWVGQTLRDSVHAHDIVGRLGGDEFVVLVGAVADASAVVGQLRDALAARTPVSIGAATRGRDGDDFDTLYASADARLYEEKGQRRSDRSGLAPTDA